MTKQLIDKQVILDKAVELALQSSWESFSLLELASSLDCSMSDIRGYFRSKDDIAETLFDRADDAMLGITAQENYSLLSIDERLLECIMCWFENLAPNKSLVREILFYKLELGHVHLQAHGITRISRTVQWFLEATSREQTGLNRIVDEVAVTSAYLTSFSFFLLDNSEHHANTRALLKRLIRNISQSERWISRLTNQDHSATDNTNDQKLLR